MALETIKKTARDIFNGLGDAAGKIPGISKVPDIIAGAAKFGSNPALGITEGYAGAVKSMMDGNVPSIINSIAGGPQNHDATQSGTQSMEAFRPAQPGVNAVSVPVSPIIAGGIAKNTADATAKKSVPVSTSAPTGAVTQQPSAPEPTTQQTVTPIAGGNQNAFSGTSPIIALNGKTLSDTKAISDRVDWSPGSKNATAYIAGAGYDEQVAKAKQVNEAGQRDLMQMSPRERAAAEVAGNANFGSFIRGGAKGDLAGYESRRSAIAGQLADNQAQKIAGIKEQGDKYTADQHLAGVKYNADAHTTAAEIAGGAAVQRAQVGAIEKQQEAKNKSAYQKQKDATALQQKVYDQITRGYDFTGISPTTVHDYATTMAKTAGKGYVTLTDPTGTHGDVIVHPGVAAFANQHLKSVKTPDQYVRLLQELDKVAAGGVHRTGIKSTQQLKPLKVSPNQIAGMTTEQG